MNIIYRELSEIKPYENNPRKNDEAVDKVKASIEEFGFLVPILIDETGEIIAGHTRYLAAEELGMEKIPCIILQGLSENEKRKYRIIDNKAGELSSWNYELLAVELESIDEIDMSVFGLMMNEEGKAGTKEADYDSNLDEGVEIDLGDFDDDVFENECPYCGFRWS